MEGWHDGLPRRCLPGGVKTVKTTNVMTVSINPYVDSLPGLTLRSSGQRDEREVHPLVTVGGQLDDTVFEGDISTQGSALQPIHRTQEIGRAHV